MKFFLWMVTHVFLTPAGGLWMVTHVFLTPAMGWMVTLVFLTPAVGWMVTLTPAVGKPDLAHIRMVNLDQDHWGRLKLGTQKWGGSNNLY